MHQYRYGLSNQVHVHPAAPTTPACTRPSVTPQIIFVPVCSTKSNVSYYIYKEVSLCGVSNVHQPHTTGMSGAQTTTSNDRRKSCSVWGCVCGFPNVHVLKLVKQQLYYVHTYWRALKTLAIRLAEQTSYFTIMDSFVMHYPNY